tara:strand:- start:3036 stop:4052 length:1017 start_codon:yes stop_codon:yes gene_type:complete
MQIWCDCRGNVSSADIANSFDEILTDDKQQKLCLIDNNLYQNNLQIGQLFPVHDSTTYESVRSSIGLLNWVIIDFSNWKMIPVENLISECEGTGTKIAVIVTQKSDVNGIAFALEKGVDAIIIDNNPELLEACEIAKSLRLENSDPITITQESTADFVELAEAEIVEISTGGVGERYCIDLTSLISPGEGLLIGSSAKSLALVHGEVLESEFVPSRPFRVNAGPPHSYILMADGKTKYLSELISGDTVLLVADNGASRTATIGRIKIEKRPFLRIYWENDYQISNSIFLQQAETVRVLSRVGEVVSVTNLKVGDKILCHDSNHTRHIGNKVAINSKEI